MDLFTFTGTIVPPVPSPAAMPPFRLPIAARNADGTTLSCIPWERVLAQLEVDEVTIGVSARWTGTVLEVATGDAIGRKLRWKDGTVGDLAPACTAVPGRLVYMTAIDAMRLHEDHALRLIGEPGDVFARFGFAQPGQDTARTVPVLNHIAAAPRSQFL